MSNSEVRDAEIDSHDEEMFPKLTPREIDRLPRFCEVRRYTAGNALFATGDVAPSMYLLIKGSVRVTRRDPLGHSAPIVGQGPGEFVAEVEQLSGQPPFVDVHAIGDVEVLLIPPEELCPDFTTTVTRTAIEISPDPSARIEAAIDEGEIRTSKGEAVTAGFGLPQH